MGKMLINILFFTNSYSTIKSQFFYRVWKWQSMSTFAQSAFYDTDLGIRFHINSKRRAYTIYTKLAAATDASDGAEFYDARPEVQSAVDRFSSTGRENARRSRYPFAPLANLSCSRPLIIRISLSAVYPLRSQTLTAETRSIARQTSNDHFVDWTQFAIYPNICLF